MSEYMLPVHNIIFMGIENRLKYLLEDYGSFSFSEVIFLNDFIKKFTTSADSRKKVIYNNDSITLELNTHFIHLHRSHITLSHLGDPIK
jgi:hypothetical protein